MQLNNNTYEIQGIRVTDLAKQFGPPLYVYDASKIIEKINNFNEAFAGFNVKLKYAAKALTNINILKLMRKHGVGIDVVSIQEAKVALMAGYEAHQIQYTPSGVDFAEVKEAVKLGIPINVDSIPLLEKIGKTYKNTVPVAMRINPSVADGGNIKISTAHKDSKFGIAYEQIDDVVRVTKKYGISVRGLHQHTGSDLKNADSFLKAADVLYNLALNHFPDLEFMDFGGGFKVAYKEGDTVTNMENLAAGVKKSFNDFCQRYGKTIELWFEPGKYLVSECGHLLVRANVVKHNPSRSFISVNSGLNHLIRPMMYDAYHDVLNVSNPIGKREKYDVVGYICETDTFASDRQLPKTKEGDILALKNAGAYGFSMSSNYNNRPRPAEVLIHEGKAHLIRKRENIKDILRNQELDLEF